jgi:hypothetical protein
MFPSFSRANHNVRLFRSSNSALIFGFDEVIGDLILFNFIEFFILQSPPIKILIADALRKIMLNIPHAFFTSDSHNL